MVKREVHDKLIEALKKEIIKQYGSNYLASPNYGKIIDNEHFKRVISLLEEQKIIYGGDYNEELLKIEPIILDNVSYSDKVMQEEIFGPILPVIVYDDIALDLGRLRFRANGSDGGHNGIKSIISSYTQSIKWIHSPYTLQKSFQNRP